MDPDDDAPELTAEFFATSVPHFNGKPLKRGRPKLAEPMPKVTIRLPQKTLDALRATGRGWQTRLAEMATKMMAEKSR